MKKERYELFFPEPGKPTFGYLYQFKEEIKISPLDVINKWDCISNIENSLNTLRVNTNEEKIIALQWYESYFNSARTMFSHSDLDKNLIPNFDFVIKWIDDKIMEFKGKAVKIKAKVIRSQSFLDCFKDKSDFTVIKREFGLYFDREKWIGGNDEAVAFINCLHELKYLTCKITPAGKAFNISHGTKIADRTFRAGSKDDVKKRIMALIPSRT